MSMPSFPNLSFYLSFLSAACTKYRRPICLESVCPNSRRPNPSEGADCFRTVVPTKFIKFTPTLDEYLLDHLRGLRPDKNMMRPMAGC